MAVHYAIGNTIQGTYYQCNILLTFPFLQSQRSEKRYFRIVPPSPAEIQSGRERWQQDTGRHLRWLVQQLIADGYFDSIQNPARRTGARWLQQLLQEEDPGGWLAGWEVSLAEVARAPYGTAADNYNPMK
ncbi:hypothetical protein MJO48_03085 [Dickeya fangzhongdai]|uniref:hypothetical protein n=1 Tax=Dickeya fangzhongdai TaxID=1778540 RepID=UPI001EFB39C8|nr:hypothetical protein [Dickeya fangzhongdai]ULR31711.1 hypothetical protein MJO48_03085 [Dickeya fangzhongdai]